MLGRDFSFRWWRWWCLCCRCCSPVSVLLCASACATSSIVSATLYSTKPKRASVTVESRVRVVHFGLCFYHQHTNATIQLHHGSSIPLFKLPHELLPHSNHYGAQWLVAQSEFSNTDADGGRHRSRTLERYSSMTSDTSGSGLIHHTELNHQSPKTTGCSKFVSSILSINCNGVTKLCVALFG